ncbi:MAG: tRNA (adenosine(37)-N6)-dimethylallyltransferase MiaA [Phycisphaeraceae bacterium]|nr:tRNA (adenosine(37)-N6)-dimethylallyltransferase MiaA [Phycisphaeraceae bacterium]
MTPAPPPLTPVICGPTAGGKSDLAVALALRAREVWGCEAEIITADAFQVYRGMDIGTAKPTIEERRGVVHHLIDVCSAGILPVRKAEEHGHDAHATKSFTVDDWLTLARKKITEIRGRGALPIVVGGTHLYIKALLDGLFEGPEPDEALRAQLTAMEPASRRAELERVDPDAAARIHPNDIRRTVRALEVFRLTGTPISAHQKQWDPPTQPSPSSPTISSPTVREGDSAEGGTSECDDVARGYAANALPDSRAAYQLIILDWESEALNRRINARVKQMMERGLLDEVRALAAAGALVPGSQPAEALGYKQILFHLANPAQMPLEQAVEKIKIETRRFGKNQRTWLRRLRTTPGAITIPMPGTPQADAAARIEESLRPPGVRR